jgi:hypothetical protein
VLGLATGGRVKLCVTPDLWAEYDRRIPEILAVKQPQADPRPLLNELVRIAHFVAPASGCLVQGSGCRAPVPPLLHAIRSRRGMRALRLL